MQESIFIQSLIKLKDYCEKENFKGWDPYDGLNSKIFQVTPLKKWEITRLAWIQAFKRSPMNLRRLFLVPKEHNAKGVGLFLTGYCNLYKYWQQKGNIQFGNAQEILEKIRFLSDLLIQLQSTGYSGACWGYNFDWQNRVFFQPKNTPTVVVTSFVANALFDAFEITKNKEYLKIALSACNFVEKDLNRITISNNEFIFSYSPLDYSQVYNASLLGARLLARGYSYLQNKNWSELSINAVQTIINKQSNDGSWIYGEDKVQNWIDSFHTGYNLECIYEVMNYTENKSFTNSFNKGLKFYLSNFFLSDGTPKYYHNNTFPIDIHSPAQFIATLSKTGKLKENRELADLVLAWTIKNMQSRKSYFFYQLKKGISSKIAYMRWAQAWMFYALTNYLTATIHENMD
jgi:hypothetical protein